MLYLKAQKQDVDDNGGDKNRAFSRSYPPRNGKSRPARIIKQDGKHQDQRKIHIPKDMKLRDAAIRKDWPIPLPANTYEAKSSLRNQG